MGSKLNFQLANDTGRHNDYGLYVLPIMATSPGTVKEAIGKTGAAERNLGF